MVNHIDSPLVSVIIVNYNGIDFVEPCLKSVLCASYPNIEIIFVDNASTDGSLELVRRRFGCAPGIKIIANEMGLGPAKGRNTGIKNSQGKYIVFLDNDTEVDRDWLNELVLTFEGDKSIGAAQSKIMLFDKKTIDSCGHHLSINGFPYEIGVGERDKGQYNKPQDIFGAKSAAMFIRKDVLNEIGYFDKDYFMHSEETDLSWRVWLNGYRIIFMPGSIVYHKRGGTTKKSGSLLFYEGSKNCTKTLIKNLGFKKLILILPLHILGWCAVAVSLIISVRASGFWNGASGKSKPSGYINARR